MFRYPFNPDIEPYNPCDDFPSYPKCDDFPSYPKWMMNRPQVPIYGRQVGEYPYMYPGPFVPSPPPVGVEPPHNAPVIPFQPVFETTWHKFAFGIVIEMLRQGHPIEEAVAGATKAASELLDAGFAPRQVKPPQPAR